MKQFLIRFRAEYYCQGYEWGWFIGSVEATSFKEACKILEEMKTDEWELGTPHMFKNLTIENKQAPKHKEDWNPDWKGDPNDPNRWNGW